MITSIKNSLSVATFVVGTSLASVAFADWSLIQKNSDLNFTSIKSGTVAEVHTFDQFSGHISDEGAFSLSIDLASVNTQIEIRDQRMQEHLFEVARFPSATITGKVDKKWLKKLGNARPQRLETSVEIDLHGMKMSKKVELQVTKLNRKQILVSSVEPIVLNAADFGLSEGVAALKKLAGLPSIAEAVPVNINLLFSK